jgi:hypothetical protein
MHIEPQQLLPPASAEAQPTATAPAIAPAENGGACPARPND